MPSRRTLVILPAWNEEETLSSVLGEIKEILPDIDVVVVNDGSTDATSAVAHAAGVTVLDLPINLGVGGAMRTGYVFAKRNRYDIAIQLDADGQHDPRDVPRLIDTLQQENADIVIGARFAGKGSYEAKGPRRWAMSLLSAILSRITRTKLSDTTSGFKASGRRAIDLFSKEYPAEYLGDTVEALVIAARRHLVIRQVPVEMRPRAGGTPSHSPLKAAIFLVRAFLALLIALSRPLPKRDSA